MSGSVAESEGLREGDEVMLVNDKNIAERKWTELQELTNLCTSAIQCISHKWICILSHLTPSIYTDNNSEKQIIKFCPQSFSSTSRQPHLSGSTHSPSGTHRGTLVTTHCA